jgi:uncharacterized protein (DUF2141 family)
MRSRFILAAFTTLGLVAANGDANATEKLSLRVTPNVSSAPGNVIVKAIVTPDSGNRWLRIEADSGAFYRSSAIQLDGDKAPAITEFRLSNLPSGEYAVSAVLQSSHGEEVTVRRTVIVLSRFGEP